MSVVTPDQVIEALRPVQDPELHRSIVDLNMVRDVSINDGVVALTVTLTIAGCPLRNEIQNRVNGAIRPLPGVRDVQLNFGVMTDDERAALREKLHGSPAASAGSAPAQGHAQGRTISFAQPGSKTRPLLISSGKGGVGKSSVTTNLAMLTTAQRDTVAVIDIGQTITIEKTFQSGAGTSELAQELSVEGIQHQINVGQSHTITLFTAPTLIVYEFILNDAVYGILGITDPQPVLG
jgi:metal-sulfur cluster biosynthetic enzyme